MKKVILTATALILAFALTTTVTSCKKKTDDTTTDDNTAAQTQNASDDSRVSSELDNATSDENAVLSYSSTTTGKMESGVTLPCNVSLDTANIKSSTPSLTINYNGNTCDGKFSRSGSITISWTSGVHWKDAGAAVNVSYNNYKVIRNSDSKSIIFNGTKTYTNVYGRLIYQLTTATSDSIVHRITASNLSITFDDGKVRTWSVARRQVWTMPTSGVYQIKVFGEGTVSGDNNIVVWGTTRAGEAFRVQLAAPLTANSSCGWFRPTGGVRTIKGIAAQLSLILGVDATVVHAQVGAYDGSNCSSFWGYTLTWTGPKGNSISVSLAY